MNTKIFKGMFVLFVLACGTACDSAFQELEEITPLETVDFDKTVEIDKAAMKTKIFFPKDPIKK